MTSLHGVLAAAALTAVVALPAAGQPAAVGASNAWVAEPAPGASSTRAHLSIANPTMYDVYVVSASTDAAARVTFRKGDDAEAGEVKELTVAAYGSLDLEPGGLSLELHDLRRPLAPGDTVTLTLRTDGGVTVTVDAIVRKR
ncbi:MAG: copper chaperone PCu(A)C [Acidobacteriota bacterium]